MSWQRPAWHSNCNGCIESDSPKTLDSNRTDDVQDRLPLYGNPPCVVTLLRNSAVLLVNLWHWSDVGTAHLVETGRGSRSVDRPLPYAVPVLAATILVVALT